MGIESVTREIDGVEYTFRPLQAKAARDQLDQLIQRFGPSIASIVKGMKTAGDFDEGGDVVRDMLPALSESLGGGIESFCKALAPNFHANLVDMFLSRVEAKIFDDNGQELRPMLNKNFREDYFATSLLLETKILAFCLEVQYSDFFEQLRRVIGSALQSRLRMKASPSASPAE